MQIFKRIAVSKLKNFCHKFISGSNKSALAKKAQNLIEFIFIMPILVFITLIIFEVAYFWQEVNAIYSLNNEINANLALINPQSINLDEDCPAVSVAQTILEQKDSGISMNDPTYTIVPPNQSLGPFGIYQIKSSNTVSGTGKSQISLWVDCSNPYEKGISTHIEFYHKTLFMKATLPRFDDSNEQIVIIPDKIFIKSPVLNTTRHY